MPLIDDCDFIYKIMGFKSNLIYKIICTLEHISSVYTGLSLQWQYGLFCQPWLPSECIEEDKFLNNNNNCQIFELLYQAASICKTSHVIEYVASVLICNSV